MYLPNAIKASALAAVVLLLVYFDVMPSIAGIVSPERPRDLGVRPTQEDLQSAQSKLSIRGARLREATAQATPSARSTGLPWSDAAARTVDFSGSVAVGATMSGEEITALVNSGRWKYYPVSDFQMRIGDDGLVEVSGLLRADRLYGFGEVAGISPETVSVALDKLGIANSTPAFYLRGVASMAENRLKLDLQQIEVGRLTVPAKLVAENRGRITSLVEAGLNRVPGLAIRSATFDDGVLRLEGALPEVISSVQE